MGSGSGHLVGWNRLDWDSEFLSLEVYSTHLDQLGEMTTAGAFEELRTSGADLVYARSTEEIDSRVVESFGGVLVDNKVSFVVDLGEVDYDQMGPGSVVVEPFDTSMPRRDLRALAIQSGEFSRFAIDQNIPRERFEAMYTIWIERSVDRQIADEVLVVREGDRVTGMVTLGDVDGQGDIGLIAVEAKSRGKRYGQSLVLGAQQYFLRNGYAEGRVVTQARNIPACRLYRKCGYRLDKSEFVYHFWL